MRHRQLTGILLSAVEGLLLPAAGVFLLAGMIAAFGVLPLWLRIGFAHLLWWGAAMLAGCRAGWRLRHRGAMYGLLCGLLLTGILLAGCLLSGQHPGSVMELRCIGMGVSGMTGGVIGVNLPNKLPPG